MMVVVVAALTPGARGHHGGEPFGKVLEPKRAMRIRGWRKVGTAVVRWPGPILVATIAIALIGLLTLPGYQTNYNDRNYLPARPAGQRRVTPPPTGTSPQARMNPELLMIESDHDLRNSADFLVIDKIAKAIFRVPGIARVQAITRPEGKPIEHTSIPFQISMQGTTQQMNQKYHAGPHGRHARSGRRDADHHRHHGEDVRHHQADGRRPPTAWSTKMQGMTVDIAELRDHIADFDDFFRPHPQLLLLGTALLRHPGLLVDPVGLRHPRRHRHS